MRSAAPSRSRRRSTRVVERLARGGRLVYVGAGSSGRLALVDAAECGPTFGVPPGPVIAIVAGGPTALAVAQEAAEDDADAGAGDVAAAGVGAGDAVVALSASGGTPYVVGAARAAREPARSRSPSSAPSDRSSARSPTTRSSSSSGPR